MGMKRILHRGKQRKVLDLEQVRATERSLGFPDACIGQPHVPAILIHLEILMPPEPSYNAVRTQSGRLAGAAAAGNHQRDASLIDQDGVGLIDYRAVKRPLHQILRPHAKAVAKEVETNFVRGRIRDVAPIGMLTLRNAHALRDETRGQPQKAIDAAHPLRIPPRKIVVHRKDMNAFALHREKRYRGHGRQRLALAGLHLGDAPAAQRKPAKDLYIERPLPKHTPGNFAADRERIHQRCPVEDL